MEPSGKEIDQCILKTILVQPQPIPLRSRHTLGDTVSRLEGGGLGLSEAIAAYEQGVALLRQLHNELSNAEQRVRVLESVDQRGCPTTGSMVSAIGHSETRDATVHNGQEAIGKRTSSRGGASAARTSPSRSGSAGKSTGPKSLPGMDDSSG